MRGQAWSLTSPLGVGDVAFQMSELEQKDQFEDEIQLGLRSRTGGSSDYFIYQMVARAYATREYKDPKQSAKWAEFAAEYAEKALSADPNDLSNIFNAGQTYELAGNNLPTSDSCRMPTSPALVPSPPTKISSRCGKTPTPTSPF
jgi:hypothetical protein